MSAAIPSVMPSVMPSVIPFAALAVLAGGAAAAAAPQVFELAPVADTTIFADVSGADARWDDVSDGSGGSLWLSTTAGGIVRRSLLRFDLGVVPDGWRVTSVTLTLWTSRSRDDHEGRLHRVLAPWGEGASDSGGAGEGAPAQPGDATWRWRDYGVAEWASPGGDFVAEASASTLLGGQNQYHAWTSTAALVADVQAWVDDDAANHGWIVIGREDDAQVAKRFDSREGGVPAQWPLLVVHAMPVPEPAPAALLLAGLAAVAWQRRRSRFSAR